MSKRPKLRLGTRGSELARTQSGTVAASLAAAGFDVELTIIRTSGDTNTTALFGSIGPQGVFVREIEQALVERLQAEQRLGSALSDVVVLRLDPARFVPAPAQGALAIQCHRDDAVVLAALQSIDHAPSHAAVDAERDALARAEGGCDVAFGAYCFAVGASHELLAMHERNGVVRTATVRGGDPHALGAAVWAKLDAEHRRDA